MTLEVIVTSEVLHGDVGRVTTGPGPAIHCHIGAIRIMYGRVGTGSGGGTVATAGRYGWVKFIQVFIGHYIT